MLYFWLFLTCGAFGCLCGYATIHLVFRWQMYRLNRELDHLKTMAQSMRDIEAGRARPIEQAISELERAITEGETED